MADDADKPDKPLDENENLVKALESIKTLLATSESKLSQARESINQASAHSLKMTRDVPVLDDVIVPGKQVESAKTATPPAVQEAGIKEPASQPQVDLGSYKAELEKEMHDKITAFAAELEKDLKAKIQAFLDKDAN